MGRTRRWQTGTYAIVRQLAEQRDEISFQATNDKAQIETRPTLTMQHPRDETTTGNHRRC